jgi:hypothetical protein
MATQVNDNRGQHQPVNTFDFEVTPENDDLATDRGQRQPENTFDFEATPENDDLATDRGQRQPVNTFYFDVTPENDDLATQSACGFCGECITRCFLPSICTVGCCCIPYYFRDARQQVEIFEMRHPGAACCCPGGFGGGGAKGWMNCCCYVCDLCYDGSLTKTPPYFKHRLDMYGARNCFAGFNKVIVQDPEEVERLLMEENGRGDSLGPTDFARDRLTHDETDGNREVLLLVMNGVDPAKPVSDHKAFREALLSLTMSPACMIRVSLSDPTMQKYMDLFREELLQCHNESEVTTRAVPRFLLRALHWGVLALDLNERDFNIVFDTYYAGTKLC